MHKKDIYEHLAKIYLDASLKGENKTPIYTRFKVPFFISLAVIFGLIFFLSIAFNKNKTLKSELALVLYPDAIKINFNFDPAKKEIYSLDLKKLDLSRFKALGFSLKKADYQDNIYLRVEFNSSFREKSEIYLKDISHKWQNYRLELSDFKNISDWSNILNLSFVVEEWNVKGEKGFIYIDNLRLLR